MGALKKLVITAYEDYQFNKATGKSFTTMINPSEYTIKKGINYNDKKAMNKGNIPSFKNYDKEDLDFEFVLDRTGAASILDEDLFSDLPTVIKKMEGTVYTYVGEAHQPPFLLISWGSLNFMGRLKSLSIKYVLFRWDGLPLRAKITISLLKYTDEKSQQLLMNMSSPDLSHIVVFRAGDTLPALCQRVYNSTAYCMEIARINGLTGFRNIEAGVELLFPPLSNKE